MLFLISNLFAIFDPHTSKYFSLNWLSILVPLFLIPFYYFHMKNTPSLKKNENLISFINLNLKSNLQMKFWMNSILFLALFLIISLNNFMGLFPYIFTPTSHLIISLALCFPIWVSLVYKSIIWNTFYFMSHLIPLGTPLILAPFMVMIETISILIRPITLSVRLAANMIAGHLLISLLSNIMKISIFMFMMLSNILILLYLLEMSVALIQAYVFMTLLSLYLNENLS